VIFCSPREYYTLFLFSGFFIFGFIFVNLVPFAAAFALFVIPSLLQSDVSWYGVSWGMGLLFIASNSDWNDMMTDMTRMALLFADGK